MKHKSTTIQIGEKQPKIMADVIFNNGQRRENICAIMDGSAKAPRDVVKFAMEWFNT